jgi:predicted permease
MHGRMLRMGEFHDMRRVNLIENILRDIRYAGRILSRNPGFTAVVMMTLAVAIGANTALFSVVDGVLLQPLPYREPQQLVRVYATHQSAAEARLSTAEFYEYREQNQTFENLALLFFFEHEYAGPAGPEQLPGYLVSSGYFEMLGYAPALGRGFTSEDEKPSSVESVIVSHRFWQSRLNGDPNIIGKSISLSRRPFLAIGVMPRGLKHVGDVQVAHGDLVDFWLPRQLQPGRLSRSRGSQEVIGRLRQGATPEQARMDLNRIAATLERDFPASNTGWRAGVKPLREQIVGKAEPLLLASFGAAGFVLLIACANLACLLLARSLARSQEYAVRIALGAGRARLVRQAMIEALILAAGGTALGLPLAAVGVRAVLMLAPENLPRREMITVDAGMLLFAAVLTPLVSILFGTLPALRSARVEEGDVLRAGGRTVSARGLRVFEILVACELALCLMLLVGAGLLARTFYNLKQTPLGLQPGGVLLAGVDIPGTVYGKEETLRVFYKKLLQDLRERPGVVQAGLSTFRPFTPSVGFALNSEARTFEVIGQPISPNDPPRCRFHVASPGYFEAIGVALKDGRYLEERDDHDAPKVVVVNEALARRYFPNESPLGKTLRFGGQTVQVVGVVGNVKDSPASLSTEPTVFGPHMQYLVFRVTLAVKMRGEASEGLAAMRAVVGQLDSNVPLFAVTSLREITDRAIATQRFAVFMFASFAGVALILATIGAYGVMSFLANLRSREFAIRIALGAQPVTIIYTVLRRALGIAAAGMAIGLLGSWALARLLETYLYGVPPGDWVTRSLAVVVLIGAILYAALIPARRGARTDPASMLRAE